MSNTKSSQLNSEENPARSGTCKMSFLLIIISDFELATDQIIFISS